MNTLIVFTHPNHQSLNWAILQEALKGLSQNPSPHEVQVLDLYAEKFDPVLVFNEEVRRRDLSTVPELERYREQIRWADQLVFIYPFWWGRPPAMLLGYIDRLFTSGFAFRSKENSPLTEGLLKGKSVICISTMKGPKHYPKFFIGNCHQKMMRKAVFNFVGIRKVKFFEFGGAESKNGQQKLMLEKVRKYFAVR